MDAHLPLLGLEPEGGEPLMSVMRGQCDTTPTITLPATSHHRPLAGAKLYCLVTEDVLTTCQGCSGQRGCQDSNLLIASPPS